MFMFVTTLVFIFITKEWEKVFSDVILQFLPFNFILLENDL